MARRRKGRDITGWIVVDKPAGLTSTDIVNRLRWLLKARKAGHAGTLDPAATGVLVVAFGEATKAIPLITDAPKAYRFTVRFGQATDTDDAEGEVIDQSPLRPDNTEIEEALAAFRGDIEQLPPRFSAVHVDGKRAYDLAREGEAFELETRPLHVARLELAGRPDADHAVFEMECGKGGYVRSIARDLGAALGCHGHVTTLRRIWSGPFGTDNLAPVPWDELNIEGAPEDLEWALIALEEGLGQIPEARLTQESAQRLRNGNPAPVSWTEAAPGDTVWAACDGQAVALGVYLGGQVHPKRVFVT